MIVPIPPVICLNPSKRTFPNGPTPFVKAYNRIYRFVKINEEGKYCYTLVVGSNLAAVGGGRGRNQRICTGQITFDAANVCNISSPESFNVGFELSPQGELFVANDPCAEGNHNYATFSCSDSEATIRTKLLAALQSQFSGKVDFDVVKSNTIGSGFNDGIGDIAIQADGKIIFVGAFTSYNGTTSRRLIRLNTDFTVDTVTIGTGFNATISAIEITASGNIIVGGGFNSYNGTSSRGIIILNPDFTIHTAAVGTGFGNDNVFDIAIQSDGKIIAVGDFTDYNGSSAGSIIRLNGNLTVDTLPPGGGFDSDAGSVALQPDGKIIIGGAFTAYSGNLSNRICRLNNDLTFETAAIGTGFDSGIPVEITLESDGHILVGGGFLGYNGTSSSCLIRLNSDLTIDTVALGAGFDGAVRSIVIESNGDIIVGGYFDNYNGTSSEGIIRLNSNFTVDTVAVGTGFTGPFGNKVNVLSLRSDGKIIAGGEFTSYNGDSSNKMILLNSDFTADITGEQDYSITVTYTDSASSTPPTSLIGTVLENCVVIENDTDMNLTCRTR